jgi:hypothetical protein
VTINVSVYIVAYITMLRISPLNSCVAIEIQLLTRDNIHVSHWLHKKFACTPLAFIYKCKCMHACTEKLTHFYMRYKAEIWQTYIAGPPKRKGKNLKRRKFFPRSSKVGDKKMHCLNYVDECIKVIRFKYKSLLGSFRES